MVKSTIDGEQLSSERCNAYIDTIQQALDNSLSTTGNLSPDTSVVDALARLRKSVEGVAELAELVAPLHAMINAVERADGTFNAADTLLVQEAVIAVTLGVDSIAHNAPMPDLIADVTARVLHTADLVEQQYQPGGIDHSLLDTFIEEATERLQQLYELFQRWRSAPRSGGRRVSSICRSLHSLKGAADSVGLEAFAALVHRLESAVERFDVVDDTKVDDFFDIAFNALEALVDDVDNLRTGGVAAEHEHWLLQLASWAGPGQTEEAPSPQPAGADLSADIDAIAKEEAVRLRSLRHAYGVAAGKVIESRVTLHQATEQVRAINAIQSRLNNLAGSDDSGRYSIEPGIARALQESNRLHTGLTRSLEKLDQSLRVQALHLDRVQQQLERESLAPLSALERRLVSVAQQLATIEGKLVEVEFASEIEELPSDLLAAITPPLEQLVRNAIVHGIESEATRASAGKPVAGNLTIHIRQLLASVQFVVSDDGCGVDFSRLRAVVRQQLQIELSDEQALLQQIVGPGLSTSSETTVTSGRGNGLDVVLAGVAELGGSMNVNTSLLDGTRVELDLPISRWESVTTVRAGTSLFAILQRQQVADIDRVADNRQTASLSLLLGFGSATSASSTERLIVNAQGEPLELSVDEVLNTAPMRIQSGGHLLGNTPGYAGVVVGQTDLPVPVLDIEYWLSQSKFGVIVKPDKPAVLVVEDSVTMRSLIARALSTVHCHCVFAHDAPEASDALDRCQPAVVLLDIKLPRGDGTAVARAMRARGGLFAQLPIVFTTSIPRHVVADLLLEVAPAGYLEKPYTADEVARLVAGLLSQALPIASDGD